MKISKNQSIMIIIIIDFRMNLVLLFDSIDLYHQFSFIYTNHLMTATTTIKEKKDYSKADWKKKL